MRTRFRTSQLQAFEDILLKLLPPIPVSENELHDSYTTLCNFPIYIKEYLRREFGWTDSQFSEMIRPSLDDRNA